MDQAALSPIVFCVMPYGRRRHSDTGLELDLDAVWATVFVPATMFERLILADVVLADVTMPNPNVFYELGIRHAARPRATLLVGCEGAGSLPFDIAPLRLLRYAATDGQVIDAARFITELSGRLTVCLADRTAVDSPIFQTIAGYAGIELAHESSESFRDRVAGLLGYRRMLAEAVARADRDALARLASSVVGIPELEADIVLAWRDLSAWDEMLAAIVAAPHLAASPVGIELTAFARNRRAGPGDRTIALAELVALEAAAGTTSERAALRGRIWKDTWLERRDWDPTGASAALAAAIRAYRDGFEADLRDPFPGVNLVVLLACAGDEEGLAEVAPVVAFALARRGGANAREYFDLTATCELAVVRGDDALADRALTAALGTAPASWMLASTRRTLELLSAVRPAAVLLAARCTLELG